MTRFRSETVERAREADIVATAEALGAKLKRVTASELAGPCPLCGGRDRFGVNVKQGLWNCRGCAKGGADALSLVMHVRGSDFRAAVAFLAGPVPPGATRGPAGDGGNRDAERPARQEDDDRAAAAMKLWRDGVDPRGTVAERYLASRGLELGDDLAGDVLRWHPRIGAMIALFRSIETGQPQAICRTFLDALARKLERKFLGRVAGAAIMLDASENVLGGLHVCEGLETGMAARQLGLRPTWALGSAGAVAAFPILGGIEILTLLEEADDASERACEACAARWHAAGREIFINQPTRGKDLNDAIGAGGAP